MVYVQNSVQLGVNIDHIATLRQARGTIYPDPIQAAMIAETAGADGITLHLREDRRHIQERDVLILRDMLQTKMNLEMAVTDEMLSFAEKIKPADVCLVPEKREELTTEGGLDVISHRSKMADAVKRMDVVNARTSLFIDADIAQIDAAVDVGAPIIEIHTGHFADAKDPASVEKEFEKIAEAVTYGTSKGLIVNAGHGLHYHNVEPIAALLDVHELNIGHAIIARALFTGLDEAVREMKRLMAGARQTALLNQ